AEPLIVGYAYIQETPFILMAVKKKAELMRPWNETRGKLIVFLLVSITVIACVVLGVSTYLVNQIFEADRRRVATLHRVEYANKMASLGRLSAGVAHEINNPLAIINEKAGLLKDIFTLQQRHTEDPQLMAIADSILSSVERCARITRRLLGFARHSDAKPQVLEIGDVIHEVLGFLGKEAEYRSIALSVDVAPQTPRLHGDRGRLQEIFLNLINNAFAALEDGGRLDIRARPAEGGVICVTVADTGCGIPAADINRIFEPFFSTKTERGGTGLGLSITYGLVQGLGGRISVTSEVGQGTTFNVFLPQQMKTPREEPHENPAGG
ncbi:MAG TPA: ATP-binding protein, partial [Desulfobacterales bacterium]|nr:ATP-binding protein [Desulfobacterales bacterium]